MDHANNPTSLHLICQAFFSLKNCKPDPSKNIRSGASISTHQICGLNQHLLQQSKKVSTCSYDIKHSSFSIDAGALIPYLVPVSFLHCQTLLAHLPFSCLASICFVFFISLANVFLYGYYALSPWFTRILLPFSLFWHVPSSFPGAFFYFFYFFYSLLSLRPATIEK